MNQQQQQQQQQFMMSGPMSQPQQGQSQQTPATSENGGVVQYMSNKLRESSHPVVVIFHLLFKGCAIFLYMFGGWFVNVDEGANFIIFSVTIILCLAADFWVVKNITGRLLVGLRWWNKVEEDSTTWIFEAAEDKKVNAFDRSVFWTVLYVTPLVWLGLLITGIAYFRITRLPILIMALALSSANVYGYYKCSNDQKAKFQRIMQNSAQQGAMTMMRSSMLNVLTGSNSNVV